MEFSLLSMYLSYVSAEKHRLVCEKIAKNGTDCFRHDSSHLFFQEFYDLLNLKNAIFLVKNRQGKERM